MTALTPEKLAKIKARTEQTFKVATSIADGDRHVAKGADWTLAATCSDVDALIAEVETLTKQREMLRLAVDDLRSHNQHTTTLWQAAQAERDEARAEVERLKKALSEARDCVREEIAQAIGMEIRRGFPQPVTAGLIQAQEIVRGVR